MVLIPDSIRSKDALDSLLRPKPTMSKIDPNAASTMAVWLYPVPGLKIL